jgi:spore germination protein GerM
LGTGNVTGGGDILRPFAGDVAFETAPAPTGAVIFLTESAENGEVWSAVVVRVQLVSTDADARACSTFRPVHVTPSSGEMEVKVYYSCATGAEPGIVPTYRAVPKSSGILRSSLEALLAGPTAAERSAGVSSFFGPKTAGSLRSVVVRDGHAVVDLAGWRTTIPNASSSAGSAMLLAELDATVFQFRTITSVEYRLDGSCQEFNLWLQYGGCDVRTRPSSSD